MTKLKKLRIGLTNATEQSRANLRQALPHCDIALASQTSRPDGQSAVIRGTVTIKGEVAKTTTVNPEELRLHDPKAATAHPKGLALKRFLVNERNQLGSVLIYLVDGLNKRPDEAPPGPVVVEIKDFTLDRKTIPLVVGQEIAVRNADNAHHNACFRPVINLESNHDLPENNSEARRRFEKPEGPTRLYCQRHPWEEASVFVLPHPVFALSDERGQYEIKGLPPGRYTFKAWHEQCKPVTFEIDVIEGKVVSKDLEVESQPQ